MKKKTAKLIGIILAIFYVLLITGGVFLVKSYKNNSSKTVLSEATASDNLSLGEKSQEENGELGKSEQETSINHLNEEVIDRTNNVANTEELASDGSLEENIDDTTTSIRMMFTGDVYIGNYVSSKYDQKGIQGIISDNLLEQLVSADLTMVNQEFPFSIRGEQMEDKQYTFRVDPKKVTLLEELGVDIVSLANNHTLDYGIDALKDTFTTLSENVIAYVGAGNNLEEAKKTQYFEIQGKTIAVLSASRVIPVSNWAATSKSAGLFTTYDPTALLQEIEVARDIADAVVVYVHWGLEHKEYPESYQRTMGKQFIDAGADVVIGSHPHVLQGFEYYNGKLIAYSLGNFIFSETVKQTAMLSVEMDENNNFEFSVVPCSASNGKTSEFSDVLNNLSVYEYLSSISEGVSINESGYIMKN